MTDICILGAGRVAGAIAGQLARSGHNIHVGVRDQESAKARWTGPATLFLDPAIAIAKADLIFNTTPGESSVAFFGALKSELSGKILIDVSNALRRDAKGVPIGLLYPGSSVAEELQAALPDTFIVKTLNTMLFSVMADPNVLSTMPNVFLSGNDIAAKTKVSNLLEEFGWPNKMIEDLGGVHTARGPESFMHFVPHLIANHGFTPFALTIAR
jgi:8-hydroxy-5-deazaflavin:NADPH oxidoreductase